MVAIEAPQAFEDMEAPQLIAAITRTDLVIAHDAAFVRPIAERACSAFAHKNWAGLLGEVCWADEGLAAVRVDDLLTRLGWFSAGVDVGSRAIAGAFLLTRALPRSGRLVLQALLAAARRPLFAVRAPETAYAQRGELKARGYRWIAAQHNDGQAMWWILTGQPDVEIAWLNAQIYEQARSIVPIPMPATRRYSSQMWARCALH